MLIKCQLKKDHEIVFWNLQSGPSLVLLEPKMVHILSYVWVKSKAEKVHWGQKIEVFLLQC